MKKIIALLLVVVSLCSVLAIGVFALGDLTEPHEQSEYYIVYKKSNGIDTMYMPSPTVGYSGPGTYKVTNDTPIAIDYDFQYWHCMEDGKDYKPGEPIELNGVLTMYAVFTEKTDKHIHSTRVILCALETFVRMFEKAFGIMKIITQ